MSSCILGLMQIEDCRSRMQIEDWYPSIPQEEQIYDALVYDEIDVLGEAEIAADDPLVFSDTEEIDSVSETIPYPQPDDDIFFPSDDGAVWRSKMAISPRRLKARICSQCHSRFEDWHAYKTHPEICQVIGGDRKRKHVER